MNLFWSGNECEVFTHSQQQPQAPKTHKKEPTIRQAIITVFCAPNGPFLTDSSSWMKSSERHTLSNQQAQLKEAETVNLIEDDAKTLSFGACGCSQNSQKGSQQSDKQSEQCSVPPKVPSLQILHLG